MEKSIPDTLLEKGLPTKKLNVIATKEKLGRPPISEMHYWWTRKPLIVSRAVLLAALIQNPDRNKWENLVGLNEEKKPFEKDLKYTEKANLLNEAKKLYPDLTVFDPFAGSGMVLFEALRLGLNAEGLDYNPVAYLIMKATLDYPKKYGDKLVQDVKKEAERIIKELKDEYGHLYHSDRGTVLAYIWAFQVRCNSCGRLTPLVNDWVLKKSDKGKSVYMTYTIENDQIKYEIKEGDHLAAPKGTVSGAEGTCIYCKRLIPNSEIIKQMNESPKETLLALILKKPKGKVYVIPDKGEEDKLNQARKLLEDQELSEYIPEEILAEDLRARKYLTNFSDLFNPRQLLILSSLAKKINETARKLSDEGEYGKAVATYLSLILAKHLDYNSRVTHWLSKIQAVGDSLANRGLGMTWRYAEPNPFEKFSGAFTSILHDVLDGLDFAVRKLASSNGSVNISCGSALDKSNKKYSLIVTDPPYLDDVPYGELSEFFYVWHKRAIGSLYPELSFERVNTSQEMDVGRNRTEEDFWEKFRLASKRLYEMLTEDGLLVVFFAQRRQEVWEKVINTFAETGFQITSAIPISTENSNNVIARGKRSIYYSLIITARKRKKDVEASVNVVKQEIRDAIKRKLPDFEKFDYDGGELLLASVGVALNIATKYSSITSFSKENIAMTALEYARESVIEELINLDVREVAKENLSLDREVELYLWILRNGSRTVDYQDFNQTAKALGLNEEDLLKKKLLIKQKDSGTVMLANAFQRSDLLEENGEDSIKGQSKVDWFHRFIKKYNQMKSSKAFDEISAQSGLPEKLFVTLSKLLVKYAQKHPELSKDDEYRVASEAVKNYVDVRSGPVIDHWF